MGKGESSWTKKKFAKLRAETELLRLQADTERLQAEKEREELNRLKREATTAKALAKRPSEKYWFIPNAASFWKPIAAGLALAGAFFFLFRPIVEQESILAALKADIQEQRNIKLELSNQDAEARLIREKERLVAEHSRNKKEYQAIIDASMAAEKKAIELARDLDEQLAVLTEIEFPRALYSCSSLAVSSNCINSCSSSASDSWVGPDVVWLLNTTQNTTI